VCVCVCVCVCEWSVYGFVWCVFGVCVVSENDKKQPKKYLKIQTRNLFIKKMWAWTI